MTIGEQARQLRLVLPKPFRSLTGTAYPFAWVRVRGNRAYISGHLPLQEAGTLAQLRGKVGEALTSCVLGTGIPDIIHEWLTVLQ